MIPGEPLPTGTLPRTRLILLEERPGRPTKPSWPHAIEPAAISTAKLRPGRIAYIRTRRGVKHFYIRLVGRSRQRPNRGRHFIVAMNRAGWCRRFWIDRVVSVATIDQVLAGRRR